MSVSDARLVSASGEITWPESVLLELNAKNARIASYRRQIEAVQQEQAAYLASKARELGIEAGDPVEVPSRRSDWPEQMWVESAAQNARVDVYRRQIENVEREKVIYLREQARELGIIASNAGSLRSNRGKPFEQVASESRTYPEGTRIVGLLLTDGVAVAVEADEQSPERAYFCEEPVFFGSLDPQTGCSWVKGVPRREPVSAVAGAHFDGDEGFRYFCQVCGMYLCEDRQIVDS